MNKHTDGDPLTELAALRQRLSNLEAEHRELKHQATRARRPAFFRKFLLCALAVALVLATAGLLYAVDALFVDKSGNVGIGTQSPAEKLEIAGTKEQGGRAIVSDGGGENRRVILIEAPGKNNFGRIVAYQYGATAGGKDLILQDTGGNVGIGASPVSKLTINNKIGDDNNFKYDDAPLTIFEPNNNGGIKPNVTRDILHLVRAGVGGQAYGNKVSFALGRYENVGADSRTQLDIKLTEGSFNSHSAIMSLRSNGNVGIGTDKPTERLSVDGRITAKGANIVQEDWQPVGQPGFPPFQNNWKNYFNPQNTDLLYNVYNTVGYFKDSMGIVHLKGMVMKGNGTIFTLPAGYRPIARELFACLSADIAGRVDVLKNGEVTLQAGNAAEYVSLDGLTFRAESK